MQSSIILIGHNIRSTHNVGSLFRTAEGLSITKLFLTGYTPYPIAKHDSRLPHLSRKIEKQIDKTALGAHKFLPWAHQESLSDVVDHLKKKDYLIAALEQTENSIYLHEFTPAQKIVLVVGNEVDGLDKESLAKMDVILEIPMSGRKESFNVVQASAMALYHFRFGAR